MENKNSDIKAVIFDWGGVLIDDPAPGLMAYCSKILGINDKDAFTKHKLQFQKGLIDEEKLWDQLCADLKINRPEQKVFFKDAFIHSYKEKKDVFNIVRRLKRVGYKVGLLSNTEKPSMEFYYEQKYDFFDVEIFSCAEHIAKPDHAIYQLALKRLGVKANEAVFIDDKAIFTDAAKKIGIQDILFQDADHLEKTLRSYSINI